MDIRWSKNKKSLNVPDNRGEIFFLFITLRSAGVCHKILRISKEMFVLDIETQDVVLCNRQKLYIVYCF